MLTLTGKLYKVGTTAYWENESDGTTYFLQGGELCGAPTFVNGGCDIENMGLVCDFIPELPDNVQEAIISKLEQREG